MTGDGMECSRAEELLSDHLEGTLWEPLLSELERHLAACGSCRALRADMAEVVTALGGLPPQDPPVGLTERVAAAALSTSPPTLARLASPFQGMPAWLQAAAAALTVAVTVLVLTLTGSGAAPTAARRLRERAVNAAVHLAERKDRLVEDFRILRVVVGTAFGSRIESLNDRVDDYRRLLEQRRQAEPKKSGSHPIEHPQPRVRNL